MHPSATHPVKVQKGRVDSEMSPKYSHTQKRGGELSVHRALSMSLIWIRESEWGESRVPFWEVLQRSVRMHVSRGSVCAVSVSLSASPFSFASWLSAQDEVCIYSLGEGKTIVPGDFPHLYLDGTKPLQTVTSPHEATCCLVSLERLRGRRGNSGLVNGLWVVILWLQPPTMAPPPTHTHWLAWVHVSWVKPPGHSSRRSQRLPSFFHWNKAVRRDVWREKPPAGRERAGSGAGGSGGQKGCARKAIRPWLRTYWKNVAPVQRA